MTSAKGCSALTSARSGEEGLLGNCVDLVQDEDDRAFEFFDQRKGKVILGCGQGAA